MHQIATVPEAFHDCLRRILTARDYALVLGMPGTGKTAVICAAVRSLLAARKTVLVTSYTNRCCRDSCCENLPALFPA